MSRAAIAAVLDERIPKDALDYEGLDALTTAITAITVFDAHGRLQV